MDGGVVLEGEARDGPDRPERPPVALQSVSPGYFEAMGFDLVAGRTFTDRDTAGGPAAVVVSESLARYLWPAGDALGRRLIAVGAGAEANDEPGWQTVVGIVGNARYPGDRTRAIRPLRAVHPGVDQPEPPRDSDARRPLAARRGAPLRGAAGGLQLRGPVHHAAQRPRRRRPAPVALQHDHGDVARRAGPRPGRRRPLQHRRLRRRPEDPGDRRAARTRRAGSSASVLRSPPPSCSGRCSSAWRRERRGPWPCTPRCSLQCARRRACWRHGARRESSPWRRFGSPSDANHVSTSPLWSTGATGAQLFHCGPLLGRQVELADHSLTSLTAYAIMSHGKTTDAPTRSFARHDLVAGFELGEGTG